MTSGRGTTDGGEGGGGGDGGGLRAGSSAGTAGQGASSVTAANSAGGLRGVGDAPKTGAAAVIRDWWTIVAKFGLCVTECGFHRIELMYSVWSWI